MKKILYIFILPLTFLLVSCEPDDDCYPGLFSIHHPTVERGTELTENLELVSGQQNLQEFVNSSFWTLTNGTEVSSNGYYLNYPDGIVTTSTNTTNYVPGDEGWFDGLTINFKLGDNIIEDGCINCFPPCTAVVAIDLRTFHSFEGELERIYNYDGIYDTVTENYVNVDAQTNYRNTQPTFLITGDGYTREVQFLEGWALTPLKLRSTSMDTFTNYWDPLNDTVYWSSYINTKTYTRPAKDESL
ncbi:MAG: hypothetical protein ISR02_06145 [Flavobacteriales bacterium]|nr:hypothetical protein [Flavobacteriales bacterium]